MNWNPFNRGQQPGPVVTMDAGGIPSVAPTPLAPPSIPGAGLPADRRKRLNQMFGQLGDYAQRPQNLGFFPQQQAPPPMMPMQQLNIPQSQVVQPHMQQQQQRQGQPPLRGRIGGLR